MLDLFRSKPLVEEATRRWLFDAYAWALNHFGSDLFYQDTALITPTDRYFPDQADSRAAIAEAVFARVQGYAGMQAWPFRPVPNGTVLPAVEQITFQGAPRGTGSAIALSGEGQAIPVGYDPGLVGKPEQLIAGYAHGLAGFLARAAGEPPPGGEEALAPASDVLAIFLGFGLFMANSAFNFHKGSCGGCRPSVSAIGALTEDEMTYALAIYAALKGLGKGEVLPHLKSTLRPTFKKALKEVLAQGEELARLKAIDRPLLT